VKGDLTFEALRQAVIEPADRVWIGPSPPPHAMPSIAILKVTTSKTPWLVNTQVGLNPGLVAIVGARGSGKTALAEIIATGAHAVGAGQGTSSFLLRASTPADFLGEARVELGWADGSKTMAYLKPSSEEDFEPQSDDARYLADITYIRLQAEFVYLAVILDAFSRKVVGWALVLFPRPLLLLRDATKAE
jgi:hypothetical protein